jgi:replication fork protection complex subunit Tof1/Swi1
MLSLLRLLLSVSILLETLDAQLTLTVVKHDNEERRLAMFKDNKLRLLMVLVGFLRLGAHDDADASWIIPSPLTSSELREAIDLIRKFEFDPPIYEDGKGPEDFLRSKAAAARRSTRHAEFDDDSDGIDDNPDEDAGEYARDGPAARKTDGEKRKLVRRKRASTPLELDDEERDRRAEARRKNEVEKKARMKSTMFVHDSDDEDWDVDKDAEFFAREQAIREATMVAFKKSLVLGSIEPVVSKKRKAVEPAQKSKRRKTPPKRRTGPFDDSDGSDDIDGYVSSRAGSEAVEDILGDGESEDEATDTPLSSQHATGRENVLRKPPTTTPKDQHVVMPDADDEDEDSPVIRRPVARNMRAGFVIDSDSE